MPRGIGAEPRKRRKSKEERKEDWLREVEEGAREFFREHGIEVPNDPETKDKE